MQSKSNTALKRRMASAWISTVISLSMVLLLVGVGALLVTNARSVSDYFKENLQVSVLLHDQVSESDALIYEKELSSMPGVRETRFISREQGVEEMSALLGQDFLDVFETAPVPISIDIKLSAAYVSADSLEVVKDRLYLSPLVEEVVYQTSLVEALNQNLARISAALMVMVLLLLFICFVLIANMVRLDIFSRRFSIHTMRLVGATRSFIRAPFIGRAAMQGLFASLVAILILVGGLFLLRREFAQMFSIFTLDALLQVMAIMIVSGVVICALSTYVVVNRLVGYNRDQVYSF